VAVRKRRSISYYAQYKGHENPLARGAGRLDERDVYYGRARGFPERFAGALFHANRGRLAGYDNSDSAVNKNLPALYQYLRFCAAAPWKRPDSFHYR